MVVALRQPDALNSHLTIDVRLVRANCIHSKRNAAISSMTRWLNRW